MDEKSWFVVELSLFAGLPVDLGLGTIDACDGTCSVEVAGIPLLSAITVDGAGDLWHAELPGGLDQSLIRRTRRCRGGVATPSASPSAQAIRDLGGVINADIVTGPYDVIARAEADSLDELGRMVVSRIQAVEGVTRTLTCPIITL